MQLTVDTCCAVLWYAKRDGRASPCIIPPVPWFSFTPSRGEVRCQLVWGQLIELLKNVSGRICVHLPPPFLGGGEITEYSYHEGWREVGFLSDWGFRGEVDGGAGTGRRRCGAVRWGKLVLLHRSDYIASRMVMGFHADPTPRCLPGSYIGRSGRGGGQGCRLPDLWWILSAVERERELEMPFPS